MKYIILADSRNTSPHIMPRQLTEINGEKIIQRTIRLLKENDVKDIIITSHDKRFDGLGADRYEPLYNDYDPIKKTGYWLNAFPIELLNEPITFLFGDVYYSDSAIKTIVNIDTRKNLFFCTYYNKNRNYIKDHDEPLAYKVVDYNMFKEHINKVKEMKDLGLCNREPIVWELYRSINGEDINEHKMTTNYLVINDESCDIDTLDDVARLKNKVEKDYKYKLAIVIPYYNTYELTDKLLKELTIQKTDEVEVFLVDDGCNETRFDKYADFNIIHLDKDYGVSYARNVGIKKSNSKYIAFIDSDDMITMDYVDNLINLINTRNEDIIYFNWADFNRNSITRRPENYAVWKAIYKKEIVPLFNEEWRKKEDVPFQDEIKSKNYSEYYFDRVLYIYNSGREGSLWWKTIHKEEV